MIKEIEASCTQLTDNANKTVEDFLNEKSSDYLRRTISQKSYISLYVLLRCAAVLVLSAIAAVAAIFFYEVFRRQYAVISHSIAENRTKTKQLKRLARIKKGQKVSEDAQEGQTK